MLILPMTREAALHISRWRYEAPYALYSFEESEEALCELLGGGYYAALGDDGTPQGYFCFGDAARIPVCEQGAYDEPLCDVGLGMAPTRCGRGLGENFVRLGAEFARVELGAHDLRLSVAAFNERAICTYRRAGFSVLRTVTHRRSGLPFYIMVRPEMRQK